MSAAETLELMPGVDMYDAEPVEVVVEVVRRWHDLTHAEGWGMCQHQPCLGVRTAAWEVTA